MKYFQQVIRFSWDKKKPETARLGHQCVSYLGVHYKNILVRVTKGTRAGQICQ